MGFETVLSSIRARCDTCQRHFGPSAGPSGFDHVGMARHVLDRSGWGEPRTGVLICQKCRWDLLDPPSQDSIEAAEIPGLEQK